MLLLSTACAPRAGGALSQGAGPAPGGRGRQRGPPPRARRRRPVRRPPLQLHTPQSARAHARASVAGAVAAASGEAASVSGCGRSSYARTRAVRDTRAPPPSREPSRRPNQTYARAHPRRVHARWRVPASDALRDGSVSGPRVACEPQTRQRRPCPRPPPIPAPSAAEGTLSAARLGRRRRRVPRPARSRSPHRPQTGRAMIPPPRHSRGPKVASGLCSRHPHRWLQQQLQPPSPPAAAAVTPPPAPLAAAGESPVEADRGGRAGRRPASRAQEGSTTRTDKAARARAGREQERSRLRSAVTREPQHAASFEK